MCWEATSSVHISLATVIHRDYYSSLVYLMKTCGISRSGCTKHLTRISSSLFTILVQIIIILLCIFRTSLIVIELALGFVGILLGIVTVLLGLLQMIVGIIKLILRMFQGLLALLLNLCRRTLWRSHTY